MFDGGRAGVAAPEVRTDGRCELSRDTEVGRAGVAAPEVLADGKRELLREEEREERSDG